jgi:nucleoside-diphosphate-sugar epimerase
MLIFGLGYTATRLAERLRDRGWVVEATGSKGTLDFGDPAEVLRAIGRATHILSSVPPDPKTGGEPVLACYGAALAGADAEWIGYLSSTGVYGDTKGAWVDESAAIGTGRRQARAEADRAWQALAPTSRVFRLPGIYGPGRSALDRVREGKAHRIDLADQVFSRVHVDDIVSGVIASFEGPRGVYNLADDRPCHQNRVIESASAMLGVSPPPLMSLDDAGLVPQARAFYTENRRVANGKAKRLLGWRPAYADYRAGLGACLAEDG